VTDVIRNLNHPVTRVRALCLYGSSPPPDAHTHTQAPPFLLTLPESPLRAIEALSLVRGVLMGTDECNALNTLRCGHFRASDMPPLHRNTRVVVLDAL
jgi:hypothetical protein